MVFTYRKQLEVMKKIFILTGEPSGDKLASTVISKLKEENKDIEYLSVGGTHLNSLGIKSIYELKEITYIAFTSVLLNIFKIKKKTWRNRIRVHGIPSENGLDRYERKMILLPKFFVDLDMLLS